jgi:cytochrome c biogenesis protein
MHALSIQHDPGSTTVYVGFSLLALTLVSVFFFSHQRVWALIEEGKQEDYEVTVGGNTNRNRLAFEGRFKRLVNAISGKTEEVEES